MAKIFTGDFKKNAKVLLGFIEKGNSISESIYLDFKNSNAYLINSNVITESERKQLKIPFIWEKTERNEEIENFFISLENFMAMCYNYEYLFISEGVFSYNNETFEFPIFKDDIDLSLFDSFENTNNMEFTSEDIKNISKSLTYVNADKENNCYGIFLRDGKIVTVTKTNYFYESKKSDTITQNLNLPFSVAKLLSQTNDEDKIALNSNDNLIFLKVNNIEIIISKNSKIDLPIDTSSQDFINSYNHKDFIIIKKDELLNTLRFIEQFVKDAPNTRVLIELNKEEIIINVRDFNKIKKIVKINSISEDLIGYSLWANCVDIKKILIDCEYEDIKIQIKQGSPIINIISFDDKISSEEHFLLILLKE
jgi:hypothetical protein